MIRVFERIFKTFQWVIANTSSNINSKNPDVAFPILINVYEYNCADFAQDLIKSQIL